MTRLLTLLFASLVALAAATVRAAGEDNPDVPPTATPQHPALGQIERHDSAFDKLVPKDAKLEILAQNFKWSEGPAWNPAGFLVFSDIPRNRAMKWQNDKLSVFLEPSGYTGKAKRGGETGSNGLAWDKDGRLILCQHGDRRVAALSRDQLDTDSKDPKHFETLADKYEGKRLNSPNDLVFSKSGDLYFTDPPYGMEKGWDDPARELDFCGVYRIRKDKSLELLTKELSRPNGIAISPDGKTLYVGSSDLEKPIWMAYELKEDGSLGKGKLFFNCIEWVKQGLKGAPDGMKVDVDGNVWATGPGGVNVFSPDGKFLGRINTGQPTANLNWGDDGSTLYVTANMYLCRIKTSTKGYSAVPFGR